MSLHVKDGDDDCVAIVQLGSAQSGQTKQKIATVDGVLEEKDMQVVEDSQSVPLTNEVGLPGDEIDPPGSILLCIIGKVNGIEVTFLIDSGANECFLSTTFVEMNKINVMLIYLIFLIQNLFFIPGLLKL